MFCTKCGSKNENDVLFCTSCGNSMSLNTNQKNSDFISTNFDIKSESKTFLSLLKDGIKNPFNISRENKLLPLKITLIYMAIISIIISTILNLSLVSKINQLGGLFFANKFSINFEFLALVSIAIFAFFAALPGILYLIFKSVFKEDVSLDLFFNISLVALIINFLFLIVNTLTLLLSFKLFILSSISGLLLTIGIFYINISNSITNKTALAYIFPIIYIIAFYIIIYVFFNRILSMLNLGGSSAILNSLKNEFLDEVFGNVFY